MMLCLDIADMAMAILVLISFVEVPSLFKMDPRYLNEFTSPRFWSFIMMLMKCSHFYCFVHCIHTNIVFIGFLKWHQLPTIL